MNQETIERIKTDVHNMLEHMETCVYLDTIVSVEPDDEEHALNSEWEEALNIIQDILNKEFKYVEEK